MNIAFIDNFDSFTYNLVHYLENTGSNVLVFHNTQLFEKQDEIFKCKGVLIGPGPNTPSLSGELMPFLNLLFSKHIPVLGVCLGQQAIGEFFGMSLKHAQIPFHGKPSLINHSGTSIFLGLKNPMNVGRYHSLVVEQTKLSEQNIEILSRCNQEIMAMKHRELPVVGVQFHPESVLTTEGQKLIQNWITTLG